MYQIWKLNSIVSLIQIAAVLIIGLFVNNFYNSFIITSVSFCALAAIILIYCRKKKISMMSSVMKTGYFIMIGALALSAIGLTLRGIEKSDTADIFTAVFELGVMSFLLTFHIGRLISDLRTRRLNIISAFPLGIGLVLGGIIGFSQKNF